MKLSVIFSSPSVLLGLSAAAKAFPQYPTELNTPAVGDVKEYPVIAPIPPVTNRANNDTEVIVLRDSRALISGHKCAISRPMVQHGNAKQVVDFYHRQVQGKCTVEGRTCKMLTCIAKVTVHWCNNNEFAIERDCKDFGDHLEHILDNCTTRTSLPTHQWVRGLAEDKDGYYIEMGQAKGKRELDQCTGKKVGW